MGNKISLGKCVCYCGFPAKRRKTKQREEEKRWEKEEMERYEIYLRAEKFKADYPEYCKKAGIGPWAKVTVQPSEETSEENQRTKDHSASTVGALSSSTKKQPLKPSDIYTRKPSSISKYSRNESSTRSSARTPAATSPKHVLSDAIQLKDNKVGSKDGQSSECTAVKEGNMTGVLGSSNDIIHNEPSPSSSFKDIDPQLHSTLKPMSPPPAEFTCPKTPPPSPVSRDITLTSSQSHVPAQPAGQTRPRLSSSRPPPPPLVTRDITPTTSQSPVPTPPVVKTRLKPSSSRPPPPLPVPRDMTLTTLQAPVPAPPAVSRKRPSRRPVRSVTFVDTPDVLSIPSSSFDDLRECFPPKSSSTSSSSNGAELFLKKSKQLVPKEVKTQSTGNKSRENNCRTLSTFKPSGTEDRRSKPLPPSFKWNGRCVYDSGYPSLMVGDRIESASEDEELWEKNIANFDGRPSVKRRGSKPPRKFTSSPDICDALRGLQEEIRELRSDSKHLRIGLPRVLESFDRRQRLLEACMDALEPQGTFVAFQESDEESASTELNSLRGDLERVNNRIAQKRAKSDKVMALDSKHEGDVLIDIEDEAQTWCTNNEKEKSTNPRVPKEPKQSPKDAVQSCLPPEDIQRDSPKPKGVESKVPQGSNLVPTSSVRRKSISKIVGKKNKNKSTVAANITSISSPSSSSNIGNESSMKQMLPAKNKLLSETSTLEDIIITKQSGTLKNTTTKHISQDLTSDKFSSKSELLSIWSESQSSGKAASQDLNKGLVTGVQSPIVKPGAVVEQATSAKILGGKGDKVITRSMDSSDLIDQDVGDKMTGVCQAKCNVVNDIVKSGVKMNEKSLVSNARGRSSTSLVGGIMPASKENANFKGKNMKRSDSSGSQRNVDDRETEVRSLVQDENMKEIVTVVYQLHSGNVNENDLKKLSLEDIPEKDNNERIREEISSDTTKEILQKEHLSNDANKEAEGENIEKNNEINNYDKIIEKLQDGNLARNVYNSVSSDYNEISQSYKEVILGKSEVTPNNNQVTAGYNDVTPSYKKTNPEYNEEPPVYNETTPTYNKVNPVYNEETQGYNEVTSGYTDVVPSYNKVNTDNEETPGYKEFTSGYNDITPSHHEVNPDYNKETPGYEEVIDGKGGVTANNNEVTVGCNDVTSSYSEVNPDYYEVTPCYKRVTPGNEDFSKEQLSRVNKDRADIKRDIYSNEAKEISKHTCIERKISRQNVRRQISLEDDFELPMTLKMNGKDEMSDANGQSSTILVGSIMTASKEDANLEENNMKLLDCSPGAGRNVDGRETKLGSLVKDRNKEIVVNRLHSGNFNQNDLKKLLSDDISEKDNNERIREEMSSDMTKEILEKGHLSNDAHKQTEVENIEQYYEINNFDKIIEELLDDSLARNVQNGVSSDYNQVSQVYKEVMVGKSGVTPSKNEVTTGYNDVTPSYNKVNPDYNGETPGYNEVTSGYYDGTPSYNKVNPNYNEETPGYKEVTPSHNKVNPDYNEGTPGYNEVSPRHNKVFPDYNEEKPGYNEVTSGCNDVTPSYNKVNSDYNEETPGCHEVTSSYNKVTPSYNEVNPDYIEESLGYNEDSPSYSVVTSSYIQDNEPTSSYNKVRLCYKHVTPGNDEFSQEQLSYVNSDGACSTKENISGNEVENDRCRKILLEDDLELCIEDCSDLRKDINSNEVKEINKQTCIERKTSRQNIRRQISLEDDFELPREDLSCKSEDIVLTEECQLVVSDFTDFSRNEVNGVQRRKIALEDDFKLCEDTDLKQDLSLDKDKENEFGRQISDHVTPGNDEFSQEQLSCVNRDGACSTKENISGNELENDRCRKILLEDDLELCIEDCPDVRKDINSNEEKEISKQACIERKTSRQNIRRQISLEDDFELPRKDLSCKSEDIVLTEECQLVVSDFIRNEVNGVQRRKIALEDDFNLCEETDVKEDLFLDTENEFGRQISNDIIPGNGEFSEEQLSCVNRDGACSTKENISGNEIENDPREDHSCKSEEIVLTEECQLVVSDFTDFNRNEVNGVQRRKIALEDDFKLCEETDLKEDLSLDKENEFVRQFSNDVMPGNYEFSQEQLSYVNRDGACSTKENISGNEIENDRFQKILLEDDLIKLCIEDCPDVMKDINSNEAKEISKQTCIERKTSRQNIRRQISLEDDFELPREDRSCESEDRSCESEDIVLTEECQLVVSDFTDFSRNESNGVQRRKIALEDDFKIYEETELEEDLFLDKENEFVRQISNDGNMRGNVSSDVQRPKFWIEDNVQFKVDAASLKNVSLMMQNSKEKMKYSDIDMAEDSDYQLNTMSDISSISDDDISIRGETTKENHDSLKNARKQEMNSYHGLNEDELVADAVKQTDDSTNFNNKSIEEQEDSDDEYFRHLLSLAVPEGRTGHLRITSELLLNRNQSDRHGFVASPHRQASSPGFEGASQWSINDTQLQSREQVLRTNDRPHFENDTPAVRRSEHSPYKYHVNQNPSPSIQHSPPAHRPGPQISEDEDSSLDEISQQPSAKEDNAALRLQRSGTFCASDKNDMRQDFGSKSHSDIRQQSPVTQNRAQTTPVYRTPDCKQPPALVPLSTGTSAPNLASKVASFQAALGFGSRSDPWKPKALPCIKKEGMTPRRSDSVLQEKKPDVPSFTTLKKPSVLPGIGQRPQTGIGQWPLPGIRTKSDRAL